MKANNNQTKLRFDLLCLSMGINGRALFTMATHVDPRLIEGIFAGISIPESSARAIIASFNRLARTDYSLYDFTIATHPDEK